GWTVGTPGSSPQINLQMNSQYWEKGRPPPANGEQLSSYLLLAVPPHPLLRPVDSLCRPSCLRYTPLIGTRLSPRVHIKGRQGTTCTCRLKEVQVVSQTVLDR
ncbi:hypothetical protein NHX12_007658, partial [Muraenolepis orangiensis]